MSSSSSHPPESQPASGFRGMTTTDPRDAKIITKLFERLRKAADDRGLNRVEITIKSDGRVQLSGGTMLERLQLEAGKRLINAGFKAFKFSSIDRGVRIELEPEHFRLLPGLLRPVKFEPEAHAPTPDHILWRDMPKIDFFDDATAPIAYAQEYVLELKQLGLQVEVEVTEPVPRRHDYSGRWKAHPPSKRKHMRSWRYAPDAEKRRYAPCKGLRWLPYWAHHPDANRRARLGLAVVTQRLFVYAQRSVDVEELMSEHANAWLRKVSDSLSM